MKKFIVFSLVFGFMLLIVGSIMFGISYKNRSDDRVLNKIIKDLKPIISLSESTLYTILKRLEEAKMLVVRSLEFEGRLRKYYHITEQGLKRLEDFKNEWKEIMEIYSFITEGDLL